MTDYGGGRGGQDHMDILPKVDDRPIGKSTLMAIIAGAFAQAICMAVAITIVWQQIENKVEQAVTKADFAAANSERTQQFATQSARIDTIEKSRIERSDANKITTAAIQKQTETIPTLTYRVEKLEASVSDVVQAIGEVNKNVSSVGTKVEVLTNRIESLAERRSGDNWLPRQPLYNQPREQADGQQ